MAMRPNPSGKLGCVIAVAAITLLCIVGVWFRVASGRAEIRKYRDEHSAARIVGKTSEEIISIYGKPYSASKGSDGKPELIMYKQVEHGQYCTIVLKEGIATGVYFDFQ